MTLNDQGGKVHLDIQTEAARARASNQAELARKF